MYYELIQYNLACFRKLLLYFTYFIILKKPAIEPSFAILKLPCSVLPVNKYDIFYASCFML